MAELRRTARGSGIPSYWTLPKAALERELQARELLPASPRAAPPAERPGLERELGSASAPPGSILGLDEEDEEDEEGEEGEPAPSGSESPWPDLEIVEAGGEPGARFGLEGGTVTSYEALQGLIDSLALADATPVVVGIGLDGERVEVPADIVAKGVEYIDEWLYDWFGGDEYQIEVSEGQYTGDD